MKFLNDRGVNAVFHYVPLPSSPAGRRYGRVSHELTVTDSASERLRRLPLFVGMEDASKIVALVDIFFQVYNPNPRL